VIAFVFPGQGARNVLSASKLISLSLRERVGVRADELQAQAGRALERTEVLQPVLTAISLSIYAELERAGIKPAYVLGHSLGELIAYAAAGALTPEVAVDLAARRGALMAREAAKHPGGLVALDSLEAAKASGLTIAAVNAPDEVVVSGPEEAIKKLRGTRVPVAGPWHSEAMRGAVEEFRSALGAGATPNVPVISTLDGELNHPLSALADQLVKPVQFTRALQSAVEKGVTTFIAVGPGAVLRGLIRKNLGTSVRILTTEDASDLARTVAALGQPSPRPSPEGRGR
jgi:[acyl-carrier-protein] S-malonyltransferase